MNRRQTPPAGLAGAAQSKRRTGENAVPAVERSRSLPASNEGKRSAPKPDARAGMPRRRKRFVL